ncbi:alpha/beta fold hydrolase [Microlunatus soli]|uniref:Pimeloyl-ACP methyl ester carboxylesterase n=1 Tax=Microlunatus soli TaxID=630515 RepID=A0A1H2ADE9_9ACTN|nr:alpha/beta hydrolase [Microlunatus soli]SDT43772.1 Pimeloyl-ACP methyl ester carboxylesterase [Microlunatus soli]
MTDGGLRRDSDQAERLPTVDATQDSAVVAFGALLGAAVDRREIDRGGRRLRWLEAGTGPVAIIFEAGAGSPSTTWAACFAAMATDHRVIAYDRAGCGASDPAPLSLDAQLADLIAIVEAAGPGPSVLVGHSWGGLLAQLATWERPDLVAGLVLVDPSHEALWLDPPDPDAIGEWATFSDPAVPAGDDPRSPEVLSSAAQLDQSVARGATADPTIRSLLVEAGRSHRQTDDQLRVSIDEFPMILSSLGKISERRDNAIWPSIPVATLTATKGRPSIYVAPVIAAQEALIAATAGTHVVVPDSGHYIHVERPDLVARQIRSVSRRALAHRRRDSDADDAG